MKCALSLVGMVRYDEGFNQESVAKVGPPGLHMQSLAFIIVLDALSREFQLHADNLIIIVDWLEDLDIERSHRGERAEGKCMKNKGLRCVYCIYWNYWMYIWLLLFPCDDILHK